MNNIPKIVQKRNEFGLLDIDYVFNDDGSINWKKMIPLEFLYVNPDLAKREKIEKKYGKPYADIKPIEDNVEDSDLIQLLGAAKYLLKVYGYDSINYSVVEANENYAAVKCNIDFIGNYLTQGRPVSFEDCACATVQNTNNFATKYLIEMATNRSFVRCIRNFLSIPIISREELQGNNTEAFQEKPSFLSDNNQIKLLSDVMESKRVTFAHIREKLTLEGRYDPAWTSVSKLPKDIIFELISRLKKKPEVVKENPVPQPSSIS